MIDQQFLSGGEKQRGTITYGIAPNRLNPMAQAGHNAVFNIWRRFASQVWFFGPPLAAAWYVMYWADKRNKFLNSKVGRETYGRDE
ncbi:Cytochrome b-c1 complex subunit 8 [Colletotrichum scovillei]|uniref:Cytochrome b-c1 complex subunit 8 n=1 Tax=Colletotrichum scovillei TaxID=1209932 RepID=A0A9P7QSQ6_9PEZI|nr:Cytochrome b-c1 complex subunit 8 [Colletotrichum scovillei]KAG7041858.1 Cytochrome b-c1 complex subunit 8 [Colletotrichum scovillei]KAG7061888.1 Cytochrome b-c1 complex subunit 8 [Colletotrichum scovillei]